MSTQTRQRVTILGSGPAGLSAAFRLSAPDVADLFDVTVYQVGWRSGGLCAGGRVAPEMWVNQNGTHFLFGCYEESLYLLRTCCDELLAAGDTRFGAFEDQVLPRPLIVMMQRWQGAWTRWEWNFPVRDASTLGAEPAGFGQVDLFRLAIQDLLEYAQSEAYESLVVRAAAEEGPIAREALRLEVGSMQVAARALYAELGERLPEGADRVEDAVREVLAFLLVGLRGALGLLLRRLARVDLTVCRLWMVADLILTIGIGVLEDDAVGPQLVERLDDIDLKEWLRKHGADEETVDSPPVNLWYDSMAAYVDGDPNKPKCAAGASLSCMAQIALNYKGAISYQMHFEAGDTFVGPIYAALKRRGVKFAFFHRAWELVPEGNHIARVVLERQVELRGGDPLAYDPFIQPLLANTPPDPRAMWPDVPNLDQIETVYAHGAAHRLDRFYCPRAGPDVILEHGRDYDLLICAVSGPTLPWYASRLGRASSRWADLLANRRSVETQGLRIWFKDTLADLGWPVAPVTSAYALPFATWEDPTPVLSTQLWPAPAPLTVAHLFGPLPSNCDWPDPADPAGQAYIDAQQVLAQQEGEQWLRTQAGALWPPAGKKDAPEALDPDKCVVPSAVLPQNGPAQIRANAGPDQAYLWLYPGTWQYRFSAGDTDFDGFYVAGDWTRTGFPCGSMEGASLSGRDAGHAIVRRYGGGRATDE